MRHFRASLVVALAAVIAVGSRGCRSAAPEAYPPASAMATDPGAEMAGASAMAGARGAETTGTIVAAPTESALVSVAGVPDECEDNPDFKSCAVFRPHDHIKIGFGGPMAGDNSAFGIDIANAGKLAIRDFGQFGDWAFELDVQDTGGTGEGGASVANKFASDPAVVAIAGHTFSGSTAAAIPIYQQARLPMLSGSATRADLTEGDEDVFNRIAFTDDVQGTQIAEYLYGKLGVRKLAIMHDGDAYGMGLAQKVRDVFESGGGDVVAFEAITKGEADYSAPLNKLAAFDPDALFYGGYVGEAALLKTQMALAGLPEAIFFSDDGAYGAKFLELTAEKGEGAYATSARPPASPAVDRFEKDYEEAYGTEAGELSTFTWHGYDIVAALIDVVKKTAIQGGDGTLYVPRDMLVSAVRALHGYAGLTGDITCNPQGECNTAGPTFFIVQQGQWVQAP
jgi:branched-chain amino acid transport system substrate-binding protein